MPSFFSRPFGGMPSSHLAQIASFGAISTSVDPALVAVANAAARPGPKSSASQSQALLPNSREIYAKRKAARATLDGGHNDSPLEMQSASRNVLTAYDARALYARRAQARAEWKGADIQAA